MGCDIHAMYERKKKIGESYSYWLNAGDPDIRRNYDMFAILGNVRNGDGIPFIAEGRFDVTVEDWYDEKEYECSSEFYSNVTRWDCDGHSHSWVSLRELKEYDLNQTYHCSALICAKDEDGKITETCAWSSGPTMGEVGDTTPFAMWGSDEWDELIKEGERIRFQHNLRDDEVRLAFFFDN